MAQRSLDLPEMPGGTAPHAIVEDVGRPILCNEDLHHLSRVRRIRIGDLVSVTDGHGAWRWCAFAEDGLTVCGDVNEIDAPSPRLTVGFALVKGSKPEFVVQKLTELGIDTIIPFVAERSVVRWDDAKVERMQERLERVSREASMQSRRVWLPVIGPVSRFADLASQEGVARADRHGDMLRADHTTVLIGPEGGWAVDEQIGGPVVGLGPNVLRAETAAIAAGALMTALRAGIVS